MNKVTVTKKEMSAIEAQRDTHAKGLKNVLSSLLNGAIFHSESEPINHMNVEQIVLAWHGYAEVKPEYVSFDEAMKAHDDGSLVSFHPKEGSKITVLHQVILKSSWLGNYSLRSLREGNWSIEGDNQ